MRAPALRAELIFGPALAPAAGTRKEIALQARAFVAQQLGFPESAVEPERRARPMRLRLAG
jgi:hypothetical protein